MGLAHSILVLDPLLAISIYIRLKLQESPIFQRMKSQGKRSKQPLVDSFFRYPNNKYVAIALFGATAGQGVVWYTGQFYALFFLLIYLKLDFIPTYVLDQLSLLLATPFFLVFGALSDRIGRKKIILAGCLIAALTYFPLFKALTHFVNPALEAFQQRTPIVVMASDCNFHIFIGPWSRQTACDKAKDFLGKAGLSFSSVPASAGVDVVTPDRRHRDQRVGRSKVQGGAPKERLPAQADLSQVNWVMAEIILFIMVIYVTMVYGPIAAFLVELSPASNSLHVHVAAVPYRQWLVRGMLPLLATAIVAWSGNIYYGLWYPIVVALLTVVIGVPLVHETRHVKIHDEH